MTLFYLIKFTTRSPMGTSGRRARRRQRAQDSLETETPLSDPQKSPVKRSKPDSDQDEEEDREVLFLPRRQEKPSPDCKITNMVRTLNSAIAAVSQDTARIQRAYQQLCADNIARDKVLADLTAMVREYGTPPAATQSYGPPTPTSRPRPMIQASNPD